MSIFKKRREEGFNLAFLDVMACGLGAVILILILVRFSANTDIPVDELNRLQEELAASKDEALELEQSLSDVQAQYALKSSDLDALEKRLENLKVQQDSVSAALKSELAVVATLEDAIAAAGPLTADDSIAIEGAGEESYLLGLKVEGQRIGILFDMSASMTAEALIEVIKNKLGSDTQKQSTSKWQRSIRILNWMLARLPESAAVTVVAFNDESTLLGKANTPGSAKEALGQIAKEARELVPSNGTNLQQGIQALVNAGGGLTDLYVITDGLPTYINANSGFNTSRSCRPIKGQQATITGECRVSAFTHTMRANPIQGVRTNIVLLPLEGDPQAPALYWTWADSTRGTFIAPAGTWP